MQCFIPKPFVLIGNPGSLQLLKDLGYKTFEDVIKLAEQSKVMWPIKPVDSISSFNTIAANLDYPINEKHEVFLDISVGKSILKMMKDLAELVPKECLHMNPIETLDYMSTHNDISYCPLLYGYSNYSREGFRNSLVHFTNIPSFDENPATPHAHYANTPW